MATCQRDKAGIRHAQTTEAVKDNKPKGCFPSLQPGILPAQVPQICWFLKGNTELDFYGLRTQRCQGYIRRGGLMIVSSKKIEEGNWRGDIVQYFSPQSDSALSYDAPLWYTNIAISEPMPLASNQTCGKSCKVDHACTASISICSGLEKYRANMLHSVLVKQRSFDGVLIWLGIRYPSHQFTPCNSVRFYIIHRGASFF